MTGIPESWTPERWARIGEILDLVFDAPPERREQVLDEQCTGDVRLRREMEKLLAGELKAQTWLDATGPEWARHLSGQETMTPPAASAGDNLGPYRLVRELARGGMGTVWLAERADGQFEQQVALKLLKRGLDSDLILARFLQERRILARLQHTYIARLLDGGLTGDGRPYFAMELVEGEPITAWCDARRLGVRRRLEIFRDVADAVQYAHRQLIIHRDLKPSNVLVTGDGQVKLLDFGIAKMLDAHDGHADSATLTRLGWRMLTPEYAAPEQLRGEAVTTSTDVYALGVLLYELLTGRRPRSTGGRERAETDTAEKPVPRPFTRITEDGARIRNSSLERLRRTLRGDLETIVLQALQPEPERRYGSVEALRDDLGRYLTGQPVQARPDTTWYRARKFIARHRVGVAAAVVVLVSLAGGMLTTAWQAGIARQQAVEAERQARQAQEVKAFLTSVFAASGPEEWRGSEVTARSILDRGAQRANEELAGDPELHAEMLATIGGLYVSLQDPDRAEPLLAKALEGHRAIYGEEHPAYAQSLYHWSRLLSARGAMHEAESVLEQVAAIYHRRLGRHTRTAETLSMLANVRDAVGRRAEAIELHQQALAIYREVHGNDHPRVAQSLLELGVMLADWHRYDEAEPTLLESLATFRRVYGNHSTWVARALNSYGRLLDQRGESQRAVAVYTEAIGILRAYGDDHPDLPAYLNNHGSRLCELGRTDEAQRLLGESMDLLRRTRPVDDFRLTPVLNNLAMCWQGLGEYQRALPLLRQSAALLERDVGADHDWTLRAWSNLGLVLLHQGEWREAEALILRALHGQARRHGEDSPQLVSSLLAWAVLRFDQGDQDEGLTVAERALALSLDGFGSRHRQTVRAWLTLAQLRLRAGQWEATESLARLAMAALREDLGADAPGVMRAQMLVAASLARRHGRLDEATALLSEVREWRRHWFTEDSWQLAEVDLHLAVSLAHAGRATEARGLLTQTHARLAAQRGIGHWLTRLAAEELAALP